MQPTVEIFVGIVFVDSHVSAVVLYVFVLNPHNGHVMFYTWRLEIQGFRRRLFLGQC